MILAITGYVGVGKTTIAEMFKENGFSIINADNIGHEILKEPSMKDKIVSAFGMDILGRDLRVDRDKLREMVFSNPDNLKVLDSIIHPILEKELRDRLDSLKEDAIIDVALFDELKIKEMCDKVVLVKSDLEHVYNRLKAKYSKREVLDIMNSQNIVLDCDYVIQNDGSVEGLHQEVMGIIRKIKS
jgi:dephospho-CoA kinase